MEFRGRLSEMSSDLVRETLPQLKEDALDTYPVLRSRMGEALLDWFLNRYGEELIGWATGGQGDDSGGDSPVADFLEGLPEAAARTGNPDTLSHEELSGYAVERTVVSGILYGVKVMIRGNQIPLLLLWIPLPVLPILFFRFAHFLHSRSRRNRSEAKQDPEVTREENPHADR